MEIPSLNGNWVDLLIITILLFSLWEGLSKGFLISFFDLLGFVFSFSFAFKFYPPLSPLLIANFSLPRGIANSLSFFIIGFLAELIFYFLIRVIYLKTPKKIIHSFANRAFGFLPAVGEAIIISAFILTFLVSLPIRPKIKSDILSSKLGSPLVSRTLKFEKDLKKIFGEALSETLTFLTITPQSQEAVELNFKTTDFKVDLQEEKEMFVLLNQERKAINLKPLTLDPILVKIARAHGRDMFKEGYFSHYNLKGLSPFDRLRQAGVFFLAAGENLALAPNVNLAHQGLMQSPSHRENILAPDFSKVGIGIIDGGIYGKIYVQEFTD